MIIERDLQIKMDDGLVLRCDVFRPDTKKKVPIVMAGGPYGKGVKYQEHYKPLLSWIENTLLENRLISKNDLDLIHLVDEVSEIEKILNNFFKNKDFNLNF